MSIVANLGFDPGKLAFAFRTAVGACIALGLAWMLGLDHPQWAAMSVWAAAQPLRGQLLEKSFFRFAGTVSGTAAGIVLVLAGQIHPVLLVAGLALWVAACTGIGNLQRGLVGYGTVLAGYTAAMVSLLDVGHPENVLHLGLDRLATVLTGVVVATLIGLIFASRSGARGLRGAVIALVADALDHLASPVSARPASVREETGELLDRIAAVEEGLDPHGAGSLRSRREIRATRAVLIATIGVLLQREAAGAPLTPGLSGPLHGAAERLRSGDTAAALALLAQEEHTVPSAEVAGALADLRQALAGWGGEERRPAASPPAVILHRDWIGAREATVRAAAALLAVGAFWQISGWSSGNFMMLGLSVMISLFSTFENPVQFMRWVVIGQLCGVFGMLVCRWLVWPLAGGEAGLILAMMPFILLGSLLVAHGRSTLISFDYNMVMLLLLQPHWPLSGSFTQSLTLSAGVLMAPLFAWVMYLTVFPANLRRRIDTLAKMMNRDLATLARDRQAQAHRATWRARLYHRTLRLIRMSGRSGRAREDAIDRGLETLMTGQAIQRLHGKLAEPGLGDSARRAIRYALKRAERMEADPRRAHAAVRKALARLDPARPPTSQSVPSAQDTA